MSRDIFTGFHHYGIYCPDLEESIAFYRDALGFEFICYFEDKDEVDFFKMAFMKLDKFLLELSEPASWGARTFEWATVGPNHFCLACGDIAAMKKKLEEKSNAVLVAEDEGPYYKSALYRGPGNVLIEFMQVTDASFPTVHTPGDSPYALGIGHFSYFTDNIEKSIEFYTKTMGFTLAKEYESSGSDMGFLNRTAMLTLNDMMIELAQPVANPVVTDKLKCLAYMSMDHLGAIPDGDMQEAIDLLRSRAETGIDWENSSPNITLDIHDGLGMQWALFRGPNGERWEFSKDI